MEINLTSKRNQAKVTPTLIYLTRERQQLDWYFKGLNIGTLETTGYTIRGHLLEFARRGGTKKKLVIEKV